jgi:Flp pilus assembly protein TadG
MNARSERGAAAAEMVLLTPLLVVLLLFVVYCGRLFDTRLDISAAARDAARDASRHPAAAGLAAQATAERSLHDRGVNCTTLSVTTSAEPYGVSDELVRVRVSCVVRLDDLALLHVGSSRTVVAEATETLDRYRSGA